MQEIPNIEQLVVANDKSRNEKYKSALTTCDCIEWVRVIKSLYSRKKACIEKGKKVAVTDERYFKEAEDYLYGELALSLGIERDAVGDYIASSMKQSSVTA